MHLQKLTSMPFTSALRQSLVELQEGSEHGLDEVLVHCVKIQYLAERVAVLKSPQPKRPAGEGYMAAGPNAGEEHKESQEREAALAECRNYLDQLIKNLPSGLKDNVTITTQLNTVLVRLSEAETTNVAHYQGTGASPNPHWSFSPDMPSFDELLQAAPSSLRSWFQPWVSEITVSRYRSLTSHTVLQFLYVLRALHLSHSAGQGHAHASVNGPLPSTSTSALPGGGVPTAGSLPEGRPTDNVAPAMSRLVALGIDEPSFDKFWAALGEVHEDDFAQRPEAVGRHGMFSEPQEIQEPDEHVFGGSVAAHPGMSQGSQVSLGDASFLLRDSGAAAGTWPSNTFIPPSRVGSVTPGQHEYSDGSMVLPSGAASIPGSSHHPPPPPAHTSQWAITEAWDVHAESYPWPPPHPASSDAMGHRGLEGQMWDPNHRSVQPYSWGDHTY
ncbi:hypothetical protein VTG60DRAFT_3278 [Thermothelomyces hinnuleus]